MPHSRTPWLLLILLAFSGGVPGCGTDAPLPQNSNGSSSCEDACELGERVCLDDASLQTCRRGLSGCTEYREVTCLASETCQEGDCVEKPRDCEDTCTPPDSRCTLSGTVETCSDHDRDGCFEFGGSESCSDGEVCDQTDGLCREKSCSDMCSENQTACTPEGELTTCGPTPDGCLAFIGGKECPPGTQCMAGECVEGGGCEDECELDASLCTAEGQLRTCGNFDGDACLDLSQAVTCPSNHVCRNGDCVPETTCQDTCVAGQDVCSGNAIVVCEMQSDGCLGFNAPAPCPSSGELCVFDAAAGASCEPMPVTGDVVINEVFYDPTGDDYRVDSSPAFIELSGPAGLIVEDFTVELVNGSTGFPYATYTMPSGARLDGNGFAVLAMVDADDYLQNRAPGNVYFLMNPYAPGTDAIQNGSDAVVLKDTAGTKVDAVAYGNFNPSDPNYVGEGSPAEDATSGRSIGRAPGATDTDDNGADFTTYYPTPGQPNSDLLINEIYFDQPGVDGEADATETFIELVAPVLGWEDLALDDYNLRAINGFNDMDYIFSGPTNNLNGIEMTLVNLSDSPSLGIVVICNIDLVPTSSAVFSACSVPYVGDDFQNGPDYFVLEHDGRIVDAVAYGNFSSTPVFGEGAPATWTGTIAGQSLGRWPVSDRSRAADTDDNATDFHVLSPSPGADNPLPGTP